MDIRFDQASNAYNSAGKMRLEAPDEVAGPSSPMQPSFGALVGNALQDAITTEYKAEGTSEKAIAGQTGLNDLVTAVSNAELTLNTVVAIRDRVISAYTDIIKMPI